MKTNTLSMVCLTAALFLSAGCAEYYTVEEACHPKDKFVGQKLLGPVEVEAFNRMNCHRRLAGILRSGVNEQMQAAATGQVAYILSNPDLDRVLGTGGPSQYLSQLFDDPGFTGANVFERLDTAGYTFVDPAGTAVEEFIGILWDENGVDLPTGAGAMDFLMRNHDFRQFALQPSWIDGGYTEAELQRDWFATADYCKFYAESCNEGEPPANLSGRVYYLVLTHESPHLEHADRPVMYPKQEQTQVPLWSPSENLAAIDIVGKVVPVQISYPITIFAGVIDPANAKIGSQNMYDLDVIASIVEAGGGPLETQVILPGSTAEKVYPSGLYHRQIASVFTREPFEPATTYQLYADVTTAEATFAVDIEFTTAPEDQGLEVVTSNYNTSTGSARQAPEDVVAFVRDHPHMTDRILENTPPE